MSGRARAGIRASAARRFRRLLCFASLELALRFPHLILTLVMIRITEHPEGCIVAVRAQPGARRNGIQGEHDGALKVAVTAPAQDGRANKAIIETLREAFGLKRSQLSFVSGEKGRDKQLLIRAISQEQLRSRLGVLL
jgi:uncharacterized protein (TIGR00251 family)